MTKNNEDYIEYDFTALLDHSKLGLIEVYALLFDEGSYEDYKGDDGLFYRDILDDPEFGPPFYLDEHDNVVTLDNQKDVNRVIRSMCEAYWNNLDD